MRLISVIYSCLWLLFLAPISSAGDLQIRFIGNQAFEITDGTTTLLSDFPYRSGSYGYMKYDFGAIRPKGKVLCLITHGHPDHFEPHLFEKTDWSIFAPPDVATKLAPSRVVSKESTFTFNGIEVQALETPHAQVNHYSYLVIWSGKRFYFTGDTESPDSLLAAKDLDVAFVTPWLLDTVREKGKQLDAKRIMIYHHAPGESVNLCESCRMIGQGENLSLSDLLRN